MEYHFVITVQKPIADGSGFTTATADGTVTITPGGTREGAYQWAWDQLCERMRWPSRAGSVLYFALEPNAIA